MTKVSPVIEGGAYAAKASVGEEFEIRATVFREGHDAVNASVIVTNPAGVETEVRMEPTTPLGFDWWHAYVPLGSEGAWTFRVEGWSDPWETWVHNAEIKIPAGIDVSLMITEGTALFHGAAQRARQAGDHDTASILSGAADGPGRPAAGGGPAATSRWPRQSGEAMIRFGPRDLVSPTADFPLWVDRKRALFSSWYEFFPRSAGCRYERHATLGLGHLRHLPRAGSRPPPRWASTSSTCRRSTRSAPLPQGREQHPHAGPGDPGSPWAIGNVEGGHDAIHPDLGDFDAFDRFVARANELGVEVALDLALNASPDHPWVTEHPEWFAHRADGSIAYAENPPKKYQDIYNFNFDNDRDGIRDDVAAGVRLWMCHGVRIFRIDNPHTKPVEFWAWMLAEVRKTDPDVLFLAEAFTKPAMMHALGKVGFHQCYTYFTWRTTSTRLEEYLTELTTEIARSSGPNFFVNTPDIMPSFLQSGGRRRCSRSAPSSPRRSRRPGVCTRASSCSSTKRWRRGREEYLDSEKFEFRPRDLQRPSRREPQPAARSLNQIRTAHPALQQLRQLTFHHAPNRTRARLLQERRRRRGDHHLQS